MKIKIIPKDKKLLKNPAVRVYLREIERRIEEQLLLLEIGACFRILNRNPKRKREGERNNG